MPSFNCGWMDGLTSVVSYQSCYCWMRDAFKTWRLISDNKPTFPECSVYSLTLRDLQWGLKCVAKAQLLTNNKSTHVVSRYVSSAGEEEQQLSWGPTVQASTRRRIRKWSTALYQSESDTWTRSIPEWVLILDGEHSVTYANNETESREDVHPVH